MREPAQETVRLLQLFKFPNYSSRLKRCQIIAHALLRRGGFSVLRIDLSRFKKAEIPLFVAMMYLSMFRICRVLEVGNEVWAQPSLTCP